MLLTKPSPDQLAGRFDLMQLPVQAGESAVVETGIGRHLIDGKKQAVFPLNSRKCALSLALALSHCGRPYAGPVSLIAVRLPGSGSRVHAWPGCQAPPVCEPKLDAEAACLPLQPLG